MFTPTLRCECAQPASDRLMRKWCIGLKKRKILFLYTPGKFNILALGFMKEQSDHFITESITQVNRPFASIL